MRFAHTRKATFERVCGVDPETGASLKTASANESRRTATGFLGECSDGEGLSAVSAGHIFLQPWPVTATPSPESSSGTHNTDVFLVRFTTCSSRRLTDTPSLTPLLFQVRRSAHRATLLKTVGDRYGNPASVRLWI